MKDSTKIRKMISEYEESLRKARKHTKELRTAQKRYGNNPDLDQRICLLYTERREMQTVIGHLKSYLRAWGEPI